MVFSSAIFLFLFLPVFLLVYYVIPATARSGWILLTSWVFYAWWRLDFLALIVLTTIWTYACGAAIARFGGSRSSQTRRYLIVGVVLNIGVLAYFKYFNFGLGSLVEILSAFGVQPRIVWRVILPVGISFYIFQATSYVIDVYRGHASPARSYLDLAAYISLFPQLIAGPILRYKQVAAQFESRRHSFSRFASGSGRFMLGFAKKVLIADAVAHIADSVFALPSPTLSEAWLGAVAFAVQLYFDFSGYSDMAIGLGKMIGFEFPENFDHPYKSQSITEFWRRWHMSLSSWLRDYLYIPLGGSRKGLGRTYVNLMLVMVLGGLWHGASWIFVLWGAFHGLLLVYERFLTKGRSILPSALAVIRTTILAVIGWVVFRARDTAAAWGMYRGMFGANGFPLSDGIMWQISGVSLAALVIAIVVLYWPGTVGNEKPAWRSVGISALFIISVMKLLADSYSPFLYFQF